jgi:hypothetical protein
MARADWEHVPGAMEFEFRAAGMEHVYECDYVYERAMFIP